MRNLILCLRFVAAVVTSAVALTVQPAQACGCGGYIPSEGNAFISQEQALLRWDGHTEEIVMSLGILGSSKEAAVILPVPSRATVKLGEAKVFDELRELTKPLVKREKRYVMPGMVGAGAPPETAARVTLLDRQTLGPFDVSNLAATDAEALVDWLKTNGYTLSPSLADTLKPYVAEGWFYVAVRMRPGAGDDLKGMLDPLWVRFEADQLVYPMRASANARDRETVTVYVLAEHRVQKSAQFGDSHIAFADWIEPSALSQGSALAPFVNRKLFLTKFQETVYPNRVNDDFVFAFASQDETYHDYIVEYENDYTIFALASLCLVALVAVPVLLVVSLLLFGVVKLAQRIGKRSQPTT